MLSLNAVVGGQHWLVRGDSTRCCRPSDTKTWSKPRYRITRGAGNPDAMRLFKTVCDKPREQHSQVVRKSKKPVDQAPAESWELAETRYPEKGSNERRSGPTQPLELPQVRVERPASQLHHRQNSSRRVPFNPRLASNPRPRSQHPQPALPGILVSIFAKMAGINPQM